MSTDGGGKHYPVFMHCVNKYLFTSINFIYLFTVFSGV